VSKHCGISYSKPKEVTESNMPHKKDSISVLRYFYVRW